MIFMEDIHVLTLTERILIFFIILNLTQLLVKFGNKQQNIKVETQEPLYPSPKHFSDVGK